MIAIQHLRDLQQERLTTDKGAGVEAITRSIDGDDLTANDQEATAHALGEFLRRVIAPGDPLRTARRFAVFASIFSPELLGISFSKMAAQLGVTRAALSKMGMAIRQEFRLTSRGAKSAGACLKYRDAQNRAVARGTHASLSRRDLRPRRKR